MLIVDMNEFKYVLETNLYQCDSAWHFTPFGTRYIVYNDTIPLKIDCPLLSPIVIIPFENLNTSESTFLDINQGIFLKIFRVLGHGDNCHIYNPQLYVIILK